MAPARPPLVRRIARPIGWIVMTPIHLLRLLLWFVWTALCVTIAIPLSKVTGSTRGSMWMARAVWSPWMLALGGIRLEIRGVERVDWSQPYFVTANHQSFLDIPTLFRGLPANLHFVAKRELETLPFVSQYVRAMGMIFVDRKDPKAAKESIARTADLANAGATVTLFPEGTRSPPGEVRRFKSGMVSAAIAGAVPILPVAIVGTGELLPRGFRCRPGRVILAVGEPIATDDFAADDRRRLADTARDAVAHLYAQTRASQS